MVKRSERLKWIHGRKNEQMKEELRRSVRTFLDQSADLSFCPQPGPAFRLQRTNWTCWQSKPATSPEKCNVSIAFDILNDILVLEDKIKSREPVLWDILTVKFKAESLLLFFFALFRQAVLIKPSFKWTEQRKTTTPPPDSRSSHSWAV